MSVQAEHAELLARSAGGMLASSSDSSTEESLVRVEIVNDDSAPASHFHERTTVQRLLVCNLHVPLCDLLSTAPVLHSDLYPRYQLACLRCGSPMSLSRDVPVFS